MSRENTSFGILVVAIAIIWGGVVGCDGDVSERSVPSSLRAAIPSSGTLRLDFPGAESSTEALTLALLGEKAAYYSETVSTVSEINTWIWEILHHVDDMTGYPPNDLDDDHASWGPYSPPLSLSTFRFILRRSSPGVFSYALLMRAADPDSPGGFSPVLRGTSRVRSLDDGSWAMAETRMELRYGVASAIDPILATNGAITMDWTRDDQGWLRERIRLDGFFDARGGMTAARTGELTYERAPDDVGSLRYELIRDIHADFETNGDLPAKEQWSVQVRWQPDGAGRADVRVTDGDLASMRLPVESWTVSECWDSLFDPSWRSTTLRFLDGNPDWSDRALGSAASCAFQGP